MLRKWVERIADTISAIAQLGALRQATGHRRTYFAEVVADKQQLLVKELHPSCLCSGK